MLQTVWTAKHSAAERLLIPASLVGVAIFVAVGIGRPVWLDEANSVLIASRGFLGIIDSLRHDVPQALVELFDGQQNFGIEAVQKLFAHGTVMWSSHFCGPGYATGQISLALRGICTT